MCFSITKVIGLNTIKDKICAHNIYVESNKKTFFCCSLHICYLVFGDI